MLMMADFDAQYAAAQTLLTEILEQEEIRTYQRLALLQHPADWQC